ncbi:hypothetical protein VP1G_10876 [Cytospora mali]|uniref:Wax synthase domain-containing protein n=1 Tax=Cytospora mali TaxID=578113 RepID=A0A194V083_CYTMA|nr:hypothetical protein VP1G_10876 [Valsa mali var. pyri (nom. inval.)]
MLLTNVVAGSVCAAWTQFLVSGFILSENFEDAGPRFGDSATYPSPYEYNSWQLDHLNARRRPDTWFQRLLFGINTVNSQRNVLTAERVRNIPPFEKSDPNYIPSRVWFIVSRGTVAFVSLLAVDLLTSGVSDPSGNPFQYAQEKASLFRFGSVKGWQQRAIVTLGQWIGLYTVTTWIHSTIAVVTVAVGVYSPEGWPPLYGSIFDVWSLRRFWGHFWHQMLRYKLKATADWLVYTVLDLKRGRLATRYTHLFGVFVASGLCHIMMDIVGPIKLSETYAFRFFVLQAVGITIEDGVQWLWRKLRGTTRDIYDTDPPVWWQRVLGGAWTATWLIWTTPMWVYPGLRAAVRVHTR